MRLLFAVLLFGTILNGTINPALGAERKILKRYQDWTVYPVQGDDGKLCFAASTPKDSQPKGLNRGEVYFYITSWPKYKVSNEVSIKIGYPIKKSSAPTVTIGAKNFTLFEKGDKAYIHSSLERDLLAAMRGGQKMVLKAQSEKGKATTDVYSLSGVTAALKAAAAACK